MSAVVLVKSEDGKLQGLGEKGERAFRRFNARVAQLDVGDTLHFQWHEPRSPGHHRKFFAKLHRLADLQETFDTEDKLRAWLTVGAGYADFVPAGPDGQLVAIPHSIAWHKLDEVEFSELHRRVDEFLWTPYAQATLWPALSDRARYEMVDHLMLEFSR